LAAALALAVAAFFALGLHQKISWDYLQAHLGDLHEAADRNLPRALVVFILVYTAVTALSLPASWLLTITAGVLFGRWLGTGAAALGATAGATLAFLTSRYLFRDLVQRWLGDRLEPIHRGIEKDGAYYLFTLRLVLAFPFFLINLAMGLTRMPTRTFAWVSLLGMLPGAFLYANVGHELGGLARPKDILSPGLFVSLALVGLAPLVIRKLVQRGARVSEEVRG
jgi:uncharacterized membrane protein YdjX (TVP38/TMEM64 family)